MYDFCEDLLGLGVGFLEFRHGAFGLVAKWNLRFCSANPAHGISFKCFL